MRTLPNAGSNAKLRTLKAHGQEQRTITLILDATTAHYPLTTDQITELVEALEYVGVRNLSAALLGRALSGCVEEPEQQKALIHFFEVCYELSISNNR